jgi:hypothetical protein
MQLVQQENIFNFPRHMPGQNMEDFHAGLHRHHNIIAEGIRAGTRMVVEQMIAFVPFLAENNRLILNELLNAVLEAGAGVVAALPLVYAAQFQVLPPGGLNALPRAFLTAAQQFRRTKVRVVRAIIAFQQNYHNERFAGRQVAFNDIHLDIGAGNVELQNALRLLEANHNRAAFFDAERNRPPSSAVRYFAISATVFVIAATAVVFVAATNPQALLAAGTKVFSSVAATTSSVAGSLSSLGASTTSANSTIISGVTARLFSLGANATSENAPDTPSTSFSRHFNDELNSMFAVFELCDGVDSK